MKKFIAIALLIALSLLPAASADGSTYFETPCTDLIDMDAQYITATRHTRALFTVMILLDLATELGEPSVPPIDAGKPSYVGRDDTTVELYFHGRDGQDYFVVYAPGTGVAAYSTNEYTSDAIVELILHGICGDGYHENDTDAIGEVAEALASGLQT